MSQGFSDLVDEAFSHLWALNPGWAVYLGKHDYDGVVPDWSDAVVNARLGAIEDAQAGLHALEGLSVDEELDRKILLARLGQELFEWRTLRMTSRSPMSWVYQLDPDLYMKRNFASHDERALIVAELLEQAGEFLAMAKRHIDPVIPRTYCEWGITAANGLRDMVAEGAVEAFPEASPETRSRLAKSVEASTTALEDFAEWLERERLPSTDDAYAIGRENMEELLRLGELVDMSLDEMMTMAAADLDVNYDAFVEVAASIDPELSPHEVYEQHVASVHADRGGLVQHTEEMLEGIRAFLVERDLITIPSEVRARVAEMPKHLRWAFAMMDTPGPYEQVATEAYYLVTPDEPEWSDEQAEEWLRTLNTYALEDISIHEAYPGHYVHFLHFKNAPTEVSKRITSYAFTEGWAHYAEQMMWEEGFRADDPRFRLAQLSEALVRNCRFVCALRLHTDGMTVEEATQFFVEKAFYEEIAARKEAERGTFDPGYFSYTLGKLQILQLRDDLQRARGDSFSLKRFHDEVLSRGAPPVAIMREVLLG